MRLNKVKSSNLEQISYGQFTGVGLSVRPLYYKDLLEGTSLPWLEFLGDNYFYPHSSCYKKLEKLSALYPLVFHFVGFNLGAAEKLNLEYLDKAKSLVDKFRPGWISDHLSFCGHGEFVTPDLLPIPYTQKLLEHIKNKIKKIIQTLQVPFLVENLSYYMKFEESEFTEEEFLGELAQIPGCFILLDVNNLYVNSKNYRFCPMEAFGRLPREKVKQIHLAGHKDCKTHIVDTHGEEISPGVLSLFGEIVEELENIPVTLERDNNIPPFHEILLERERIVEVING